MKERKQEMPKKEKANEQATNQLHAQLISVIMLVSGDRNNLILQAFCDSGRELHYKLLCSLGIALDSQCNSISAFTHLWRSSLNPFSSPQRRKLALWLKEKEARVGKTRVGVLEQSFTSYVVVDYKTLLSLSVLMWKMGASSRTYLRGLCEQSTWKCTLGIRVSLPE